MGAPELRGAASRLQRLGALVLGCAGAAALAWHCAASPEVTWIAEGGDAAWITDPRPVDLSVQQYGRSEVPVATFARRFELAAAPARAELRVQAARAYRVHINGALAWESSDPDPAWRRERTRDVADLLRAGPNEIAVEVWNPRGPPLLRARLALPDRVIPSGVDWSVAVDGAAAAPAALPDDTRAPASAAAGPRPARELARHGAALAGVVVLALAAWSALGRRTAPLSPRLPQLALAFVHLLWLAIFAGKFARIPLTSGFDATNHLRYVELLRQKGAVPLPSDGWSTYHPPLYYAFVAALQSTLGALGPAWSAIGTKLPSFAAGLGQVWLAYALARVLAPARADIATLAVLFAGCLPLNLYSSAYVSNEPLHAFWFGLAAVLTARSLARGRVRPADAWAVGVALGLALLTKVTALVAAGVAIACLLSHAALLERARPARLLALAAGLAVPPLVLAGWFYARNLRLYGTPLVGNWNLPGMLWWSQPGFHTASYYLGFGESLRLPVLAGFHSLADALYSSFWGDGWIAGRATLARLPESWSWPWVAIGYWLALPVTAVLAVGIAESIRRAFAPSAAWTFVVALEAALAFALVWLTLDLPYFGQAKAPYLLGLVAPLAVSFALGAELCDRLLLRAAGRSAATAGRALLTTAGVVFVLSFAA